MRDHSKIIVFYWFEKVPLYTKISVLHYHLNKWAVPEWDPIIYKKDRSILINLPLLFILPRVFIKNRFAPINFLYLIRLGVKDWFVLSDLLCTLPYLELSWKICLFQTFSSALNPIWSYHEKYVCFKQSPLLWILPGVIMKNMFVSNNLLSSGSYMECSWKICMFQTISPLFWIQPGVII